MNTTVGLGPLLSLSYPLTPFTSAVSDQESLDTALLYYVLFDFTGLQRTLRPRLLPAFPVVAKSWPVGLIQSTLIIQTHLKSGNTSIAP